MKQYIVGLFDITAKELIAVTTANNEKVAIRDLDGVVNDPNKRSNISKFPTEFELKVLGIVDTNDCSIITQFKDENGTVKPILHTVINLGNLVNDAEPSVKADGLPQNE